MEYDPLIETRMFCRYCGEQVYLDEDYSTTSGYWSSQVFPCHGACKANGIKEEAYVCQLIDADCNDCKFFVRGEYIKPPYKYFNGVCSKYNRQTKAFPVTYTGHQCFEHRRG